jgi:hypothetical protein
MRIDPVLIKQKEYEGDKFYHNIVVQQIGSLWRFHEWATESEETEIFFDNEEEAITYFDDYISRIEE